MPKGYILLLALLNFTPSIGNRWFFHPGSMAVTTMKNKPPQLVLRQSQPGTKLGPIGNTISFMANWPPLVLYGLLVIAPFPLAISCHHWPPWPTSTSPTSRPLSLFLGPGVLSVFQGSKDPLASWPNPLY
ncbi:hypothetical protein O181_074562 [Austropuccinia psidii MF-1]|uniref:Uncharacterized protein n=1 Tax=Austropuccinia psidii MF-1 TaxID=1389203 RepID=A0A9Q3FB53_9BASI|nr:hypothetical protein [Austropuccinia psidii MF-1]